jgi:hypothetical protein
VVGGANLDPDVCWRFPVLGVVQHRAICRIYSLAKRMLLFWATLVALALGHSRSEPGSQFLIGQVERMKGGAPLPISQGHCSRPFFEEDLCGT